MPWFQSASSRYSSGSPTRNATGDHPTLAGGPACNDTSFACGSIDENRYYGGVMKSSTGGGGGGGGGGSIASGGGKTGAGGSPLCVPDASHSAAGPFHRTRSVDSTADFRDTEWTPPDSSYGAACPVCGCVPKNVRRMVEFSMIAAMVVAFVYLLITTSIDLSDERNRNRGGGGSNSTSTHAATSSGGGSGQSALTDDGFYIESSYKADDELTDDAQGKNNGNGYNSNYNRNGGGYYYYHYKYKNSGGDNNDDGNNNQNANDGAYQAAETDDGNGGGGGGRERIRHLRSWI